MSQDDEMFFIIADISGYTAYMIKNNMAYSHGVLVVNELIKSLVKEIETPMELAKLEGDALFLFLRRKKLPKKFESDPNLFGLKILNFLSVFKQKLQELQSSTACDCGGCANIDQLRLKIIVHYGRANIEKIGSFKELAGVDVILVHRLLKNQIHEKQYVLLTESARQYVSVSSEDKMVRMEEYDKDIGKIPIYVYSCPDMFLKRDKHLGFFDRIKSHCKLMIGTFVLKLSLKRQVHHFSRPKKYT